MAVNGSSGSIRILDGSLLGSRHGRGGSADVSFAYVRPHTLSQEGTVAGHIASVGDLAGTSRSIYVDGRLESTQTRRWRYSGRV